MKRILSHRSFLFGISALILTALILSFPKVSANSAAEAADTWLRVILPTLLPFAILSGIFVKSGTAQKLSRFAAPLSRLLGFSECFSFILGMSLLSGYPIGARLTAALHAEGQLSDEEASLAVNAASTSGPGFLISAVAVGMLGSAQYIPAVLLPHIFSAIVMAKLNGSIPHPHILSSSSLPARKSVGAVFLESVSEAVNSMLIVLGAMVVFGALSAVLRELLQSFSAEWVCALLTGILEFSSGCICASSLSPALSLPLIAFISGFGSISVVLQTAAICSSEKIALRRFLPSKLLQGALAALFAAFYTRSLKILLICAAAALCAWFIFFRGRDRTFPQRPKKHRGFTA